MGPKLGFSLFSQVWPITSSLNHRRCLATSSGKICIKFGPNGPKLGPKLGFFPFCQVWFIGFPRNCIGL